MKNLFDFWAKRTPSYNESYVGLFESYALKGNAKKGDEKGKVFETNYELYIFAFFIGLYNENTVDSIPGQTNNFGYAIENWGKKSIVDLRQDFSSLQKYIFSILIVKSDIDFIKLEKSSDSDFIKESVTSLIRIMEKYANGGLQILFEKVEDDPNLLYKSDLAALNLILETID